MSVDEFFAFKLAIQVQFGVALIVGVLVMNFAPWLFDREGFGWAFGLLLLTYVVTTMGAMQRKILQVHTWLKERKAK